MNNTPNRPASRPATNPNPNLTAGVGTNVSAPPSQTEPAVRRPATPARAVRRPGEPTAVSAQEKVSPAGTPAVQQSVSMAGAVSAPPTVRRPAQTEAGQPAAKMQRQTAQLVGRPAPPSSAAQPKPMTTAQRPQAKRQAVQNAPQNLPQNANALRSQAPGRRQQTTDAPTAQVDLAHRMAAADNSATRRMAVTPPAGQKPVHATDAKADSKSGNGNREKKKKKQMSEGAATLLSVVKAVSYIVLVIVIAGFLSYYTIRIANDMFAFVKSDEQVDVVIPEYATIDDVSEILAEHGIITYPDIFKLYARLNKDDGIFMAGTYEVNGMMNYDELLMTFKEKIVREIVRLTIPEGYTVDEIIDLFLENGIGGTREDWIAAVNDLELYSNFAFVQALIGNTSSDRTYALEGYLFPDTYDFYTDAKASQIIYKLLNRFNNIFKDEFYTRSAELGYTVDEIITLASMIEKETRLYNEFELVSSVFHNRLHNAATYPCLESDATIMYAIQHDTGSRKEQLLHEDLSYNSPYNTYTHQGLPPGPIANPSYQAITCALYPEESNYYYFVTGKNGETIFSTTLAEHNAAVAEARG